MRHLLAAVGLLAAAAGVPAQQAPPDPSWVVDERLDVGLRQLYVTVTGRGGERVLDLPAEAFRVVDDDRPQDIVTFEGGDLPITAALVVDGSLSMRGAPLAAAVSGVEAFARGMKELDEASALVFSDRLLRRTLFAGTAARVLSGLEGLAAEGGSAVHDHLYLALKMLEERQGRRVALLFSDGLDAQSVVPFDAVERAARVGRSLVYWVRMRSPRPPRAAGLTRVSWVGPRRGEREHRALGRLVARSGGRIVEIGDLSEVAWAFGEVLAELREQYAIGYYPDPPRTGSGRFRGVRVTVRRPGLAVRTRDGYLDR